MRSTSFTQQTNKRKLVLQITVNSVNALLQQPPWIWPNPLLSFQYIRARSHAPLSPYHAGHSAVQKHAGKGLKHVLSILVLQIFLPKEQINARQSRASRRPSLWAVLGPQHKARRVPTTSAPSVSLDTANIIFMSMVPL